jgi:hypothetical protein
LIGVGAVVAVTLRRRGYVIAHIAVVRFVPPPT